MDNIQKSEFRLLDTKVEKDNKKEKTIENKCKYIYIKEVTCKNSKINVEYL